MGRRSKACAAWAILIWLATPSTGLAQQRAPATAGRLLSEALAELQRRGLPVIFSSEVVRPSMRVIDEPRLSTPRRQLEALLEPHGLISRDGPAGTVLVVKNPRARLVKRVENVRASSPSPPTSSAPRYDETIQVLSGVQATAVAGAPVVALRALDVRDYAGGFENVFRTLTSLPGVTGADELGGRIAVRGGAPDQNLTVMDGVEIHNPFRLIVPSEDLALVGLATTFNPDTVERVEFIPGAFDVQYGDRLSSLLVVNNRDGSQTEALQGTASLSLGDLSTTIEGRLPGRGGAWLVSARRTYLGLFAERLTKVALPTYTDVHARAAWTPMAGQRWSVMAIEGRERLRRSTGADAGAAAATNNSLVGLTVEASLKGGAFSRIVASRSAFSDALDADERSLDNSRGANTPNSIASGGLLQFNVKRRITVNDLALRQDLLFAPSTQHALSAGAEVHRLDTGWAWDISGDRSLQQANGSSIRLGAGLPSRLDSARHVTRAGAWVKDKWTMGSRLVIEPAVRLDESTGTGPVTVSPRLSVTTHVGAGWRLDGAVRLQTQTPGYEKMLQSDYFVDLSAESSRGLRAERSLQSVLGAQRSFRGGFTARLDAYYKRYRDLIVGRLETDEERLARLASYDVPASLWSQVQTASQVTTLPVNAGRGRAYGLEVQLSRGAAGAPLTGRITYSLGTALRSEYGFTRPFDYDRRHGLTAAVNAKLGSRLDLSLTGRATSGLPRTSVRGVRLSLVQDTADADGDGNRSEWLPQRNSEGAPVYQPDYGDVSHLNGARLPHFARLDMRLTYRPAWGGERWAVYADVVNVLNGKNISQVDSFLTLDPGADQPRIIEAAQDRGIPFFPSVGIRFWF